MYNRKERDKNKVGENRGTGQQREMIRGEADGKYASRIYIQCVGRHTTHDDVRSQRIRHIRGSVPVELLVVRRRERLNAKGRHGNVV